MYETARMLVLSTAHLTPETCNEWLKDPCTCISAFPKGDYGWFVYVFNDDPEDMPTDFEEVLHYARHHKFDWIMFDRDANIIPGLTDHSEEW